jgi:hypothetical protein
VIHFITAVYPVNCIITSSKLKDQEIYGKLSELLSFPLLLYPVTFFHSLLKVSVIMSFGFSFSPFVYFCKVLFYVRSRDSAVNIARGRSSSPGRVKNFLLSMSSTPALGSTQSPIQWVPGAFSPGVKRPGREADHSPPTSLEFKKM